MVGYPLDTIKVHMQTQDYRNPKYKGTWDCFRTLLAKESVFYTHKNQETNDRRIALIERIVKDEYFLIT